MSLANTTVKSISVGNGANKTFAIPFTPIVDDSAETVVYLRDETDPDAITYTLLEEGALNDYTLTGAPDANSFHVNVELTASFTAPTATQYIIIARVLPLTQTMDMTVSNFRPPTVEEMGDRLAAMIQQLNEKLSRVPIFDPTERQTEASMIMPTPETDTVLTWNGTGWEWTTFAAIASGGGSGITAGGTTGQVLRKASDDDGDGEWASYGYEGYSARFSESVDLATLQETLDYIMDITYTAPLITLTASGSGTIREKGTAVLSSTLTAAITKRSDPILTVRFYENTNALVDTQVAGGGIPSGGNSTYSWTGSFSDTYVFKAEVDDNGATGGPTTVSSTVTFTFVYPYYYGGEAAALSAANVRALLTQANIASSSSLTRTLTAGAGDVLYFAYPASYGALTSILDVNGFETFPDWTLRTENITGLDATAQSYRIYEFNNPLSAGDYQYTFIR